MMNFLSSIFRGIGNQIVKHKRTVYILCGLLLALVISYAIFTATRV